ncbi:hypothetical protein [Pseudomonas viridiflava]|uniref:hypothetical protein n=1 Tax=Pseudomonas viridiflava TaxID=33069 RepID=UPI000F02DD7D|nr:hypothetical protein [Pseudomonas viridiflava]
MTHVQPSDELDEQLNSIRLELLALNSRLDALFAQQMSSSANIASLQQAVAVLQESAQIKR